MKAFLRARHFVLPLLLLAGGAASAAGSLETYFLVKEQNFFQINDVTVNPASNKPFTFQCNVETTSPNPFDSVYLYPPSATPRLVEADGPDAFRLENIFTSKGSMDLLFGPGTYTLEFASETDFYEPLSMTMPNDNYPSTPMFTDTPGLQSVNPSNAFIVTWQSFSLPTTNDYIQFSIDDYNGHTIFETGEPGAPDALNSSSTFLSLPAHTLTPGETYTARLLFARFAVRSTNVFFPGARGFIAFAKETEVALATTGTPPAIQLQPVGKVDGHFQFRFTTQPGRSYQIQNSEALPVWNNLWFTNATSNDILFTDPYFQPGTRFYRVLRQ